MRRIEITKRIVTLSCAEDTNSTSFTAILPKYTYNNDGYSNLHGDRNPFDIRFT